jgi:hypothetical protein
VSSATRGETKRRAGPPADFGPIQLAGRLGLAEWQFEAARERGLIPEPDAGRRWSAPAAAMLGERVPEIVAVVGSEIPVGGHKAAERLAQRSQLEVQRADVEELAAQGLLHVFGYYKEWPVYDRRELDALAVEQLATVIAERQAWEAASLHRRAAAAELGWHLHEFDRVVGERGIAAGRFGRFARADLEAMAGDEDLVEQVAADRLIGPEQAAARLEVRRTDWDYAVAAGWIAPRDYAFMEVGWRRTVTVPLYRAADVEGLLQLPGVDWDTVRGCRPGEPSPLREFARRPPTRAQVVRSWCAELAARFGVEVWAVYLGGPDRWEVDWERDGAAQPTRDQVLTSLEEHVSAAGYRGDIRIDTEAGAAIRWARAMLEPGAAVILDTETTDLPGAVCELGVLDTDGTVLLDTLVDPGRPISSGARAVHGISDADVAGAPTWDRVLPRLLEVTRGRQVLAYNADFDQGVVVADCQRRGLDAAHLAERERWGCLMQARSDWRRTWRWMPLWGRHRAIGDCEAALDVLRAMTAP